MTESVVDSGPPFRNSAIPNGTAKPNPNPIPILSLTNCNPNTIFRMVDHRNGGPSEWRADNLWWGWVEKTSTLTLRLGRLLRHLASSTINDEIRSRTPRCWCRLWWGRPLWRWRWCIPRRRLGRGCSLSRWLPRRGGTTTSRRRTT